MRSGICGRSIIVNGILYVYYVNYLGAVGFNGHYIKDWILIGEGQSLKFYLTWKTAKKKFPRARPKGLQQPRGFLCFWPWEFEKKVKKMAGGGGQAAGGAPRAGRAPHVGRPIRFFFGKFARDWRGCRGPARAAGPPLPGPRGGRKFGKKLDAPFSAARLVQASCSTEVG